MPIEFWADTRTRTPYTVLPPHIQNNANQRVHIYFQPLFGRAPGRCESGNFVILPEMPKRINYISADNIFIKSINLNFA